MKINLKNKMPPQEHNLVEREQRFKELTERVYKRAIERKDGSRVRHLVRVVTKAYKDNPDILNPSPSGICPGYPFNGEFVLGIASSAYHFLTGDFSLIQRFKDSYGGLGTIITESEEGLEFSHKQLNFARISGTALRKSKNSGNALQYAETSGNALEESMNSGKSLQFSKNSGNSLRNSRNYGYALRDSENCDYALCGSTNSEFALISSKNSGNALRDSANRDIALYGSINQNKALHNATLPDYQKQMVPFLKKWMERFYHNKYGNEGCGDVMPGDNLYPDYNYSPRYQDELFGLKKLLDQESWPELSLWKLESLLKDHGGGRYSNPQYFKEGGTRYLFTVEWGPGKIKRIIKVDKPLSALISPQARRDVGERGCGTANDLEFIAQLHHPGIVQLLDYFPEDMSEKYGLSGAITVEEFCEGYQSLEELVKQNGPFRDINQIKRLMGSTLEVLGYINEKHIFHRDLKPSNILVGKDIKITDWANACGMERTKSKYSPTAGGHLITDPLLMDKFTGEESSYDTSSEIYSLMSCWLFAVRGSYLFNYNPNTGEGYKYKSGRSLLNQLGKLDADKHDQILLEELNYLPVNIRNMENFIEVMMAGLTIRKWKRFETFESLAYNVNRLLKGGMDRVMRTRYDS